jgi:integrase
MTIRTSITRRERKRILTTGATVFHARYVLNFRDPRTGKRRQLFFRSQREAIAKRDAILAAIATHTYSQSRSNLTVANAVEHWLENRRADVKASTWKTYRQISTNCIIGPVLVGTPAQRKAYREEGAKPEGTHFVDALGPVKIGDLTTGDIRRWHRTLLAEVGSRSANMSKTLLRAALSLAAEDFSVRPPPMPTKLGRGRARTKRTLLTSAQVGVLLKAALEDPQRGIYCAWPFLTGTRPSEQLGVLWEDIDLERNVVSIRRMQERNGELFATTKTVSGAREIPLTPTLREMLVAWRSVCPRCNGELHRVFPGPKGGALTYWNWRARYFKPALHRLGLPPVTPHSARHGFISALQAQGVEVGLVAKLAGHANAGVTLNFYTRAVRGGEAAMAALEEAFDIRRCS